MKERRPDGRLFCWDYDLMVRSGRNESVTEHDFFQLGEIGFAGDVDLLSNFFKVSSSDGSWIDRKSVV